MVGASLLEQQQQRPTTLALAVSSSELLPLLAAAGFSPLLFSRWRRLRNVSRAGPHLSGSKKPPSAVVGSLWQKTEWCWQKPSSIAAVTPCDGHARHHLCGC